VVPRPLKRSGRPMDGLPVVAAIEIDGYRGLSFVKG
jgi:hypothetical protein